MRSDRLKPHRAARIVVGSLMLYGVLPAQSAEEPRRPEQSPILSVREHAEIPTPREITEAVEQLKLVMKKVNTKALKKSLAPYSADDIASAQQWLDRVLRTAAIKPFFQELDWTTMDFRSIIFQHPPYERFGSPTVRAQCKQFQAVFSSFPNDVLKDYVMVVLGVMRLSDLQNRLHDVLQTTSYREMSGEKNNLTLQYFEYQTEDYVMASAKVKALRLLNPQAKIDNAKMPSKPHDESLTTTHVGLYATPLLPKGRPPLAPLFVWIGLGIHTWSQVWHPGAVPWHVPSVQAAA